jgi:hypothetical protein
VTAPGPVIAATETPQVSTLELTLKAKDLPVEILRTPSEVSMPKAGAVLLRIVCVGRGPLGAAQNQLGGRFVSGAWRAGHPLRR